MSAGSHLEDVDDEGEDVADEEDQHDHHQHRRQAHLFLLQPGITIQQLSKVLLISNDNGNGNDGI